VQLQKKKSKHLTKAGLRFLPILPQTQFSYYSSSTLPFSGYFSTILPLALAPLLLESTLGYTRFIERLKMNCEVSQTDIHSSRWLPPPSCIFITRLSRKPTFCYLKLKMCNCTSCWKYLCKVFTLEERTSTLPYFRSFPLLDD
jgi:hypothetical protein